MRTTEYRLLAKTNFFGFITFSLFSTIQEVFDCSVLDFHFILPLNSLFSFARYTELVLGGTLLPLASTVDPCHSSWLSLTFSYYPACLKSGGKNKRRSSTYPHLKETVKANIPEKYHHIAPRKTLKFASALWLVIFCIASDTRLG